MTEEERIRGIVAEPKRGHPGMVPSKVAQCTRRIDRGGGKQPVKRVYFILKRCAGDALIKIGATGDCPYMRLDQLRRAQLKQAPYDRFELMGVLNRPSGNKAKIQEQFSSLREEGDWFRSGRKLLEYISEKPGGQIENRSRPNNVARYSSEYLLD